MGNISKMAWLLGILCLILLGVLGVSVYFMIKFAMIIMVCEDDYSSVIDMLLQTQDSLDGILEMNLFFESPEVRESVEGAIEEVKLCRIEVTRAAERFVQKSNNKYVIYNEPEFREEDMGQQQLLQQGEER